MRRTSHLLGWPITVAAISSTAVLLGPTAGAAGSAATIRIDVGLHGQQANGDANPEFLAVNGDGSKILYGSLASNLVSGDTNKQPDVFVRDTKAGRTIRANVSSSGAQANGGVFWANITPNGRYVVFDSYATNLVPGDTNGHSDVFVHDLQTGTTRRASLSSSGAQDTGDAYGDSISADGRYIAFASDQALAPKAGPGIYEHDMQTGRTVLVSVSLPGIPSIGADLGLGHTAVSGNGRYVAFTTNERNLVKGDTNGAYDVFVRDMVKGVTRRVSVSSKGAQANADSDITPRISDDGRYVMFSSDASNLVPHDTNQSADVFVHDMTTGTTTLVDVSATGAQSPSNAQGTAFSSNGQFVTFATLSPLVKGDTNSVTDVYLRDLVAGTTSRVDLTAAGKQSEQGASFSAVSDDGRFVAFATPADDMVPGDTNGFADVFVRGPLR